jgi:hypothetical protein
MKMTELNYAEQIEINGGRILSRRETTGGGAGGGAGGGGGRSWSCERDWGKVGEGVRDIAFGLFAKGDNKDNPSGAVSGLVDFATDKIIERGSKKLKEGWYGGCGHSRYKREHKK